MPYEISSYLCVCVCLYIYILLFSMINAGSETTKDCKWTDYLHWIDLIIYE